MADIFASLDLLANSKLENQRQILQLLKAVRETILEQNEQLSPLAYFGTLMTILEQNSLHLENVALVASASYLLAICISKVPTTVLRLKFQDIANILMQTMDTHSSSNPVARAILSCIELLLMAQDQSYWSLNLLVRKLFLSLMACAMDPRPKVRKGAQDSVKRILSNPPAPCIHHPATPIAIDFCSRTFNDVKESNETAIFHILAFVKMNSDVFAKYHPQDSTVILLQALLSIPKKSSGNSILTKLCFEVLEVLVLSVDIDTSSETYSSTSLTILDTVTRSVMEIKPYQNDSNLTPVWLELMGNCFCQLAEILRSEPDANLEYHHQIFPDLLSSFFIKTFVGLFSSDSNIKPVIKTSTTVVLSNLIIQCVTDKMIHDIQGSMLPVILKNINNGLVNIRFRESLNHVLAVSESLFVRVGPISPHLCLETLKILGNHRDDPTYANSYPFKEQLENTLATAAQKLGLDIFLTNLPLNVENQQEPKRPYLLASLSRALLRQNIESPWIPNASFGPHSLSFYVENLFQFSKRMFDKSEGLFISKKELEAKLFETLGIQALELLPIVCSTKPVDVDASFDRIAPELGHMIQTLPDMLYPNLPSHPDFRSIVCDSLKKLIIGYSDLAAELDDGEELENAGNGIMKIKEYANKFLSSLCNIYTTIPPEMMESAQKGQALQTLYERQNQYIEKSLVSFLSIADQKDIILYFEMLVNTLSEIQTREESDENAIQNQMEKLRSYAIMELLLILLPFIEDYESQDESSILKYYGLLLQYLQERDSTTQKRTYKSLVALIETIPIHLIDLNELASKLLEKRVITNALSGAKKARLILLQRITESVPSSNSSFLLEWIPLCIPEIMLATKEASEKARNAAYECLLAMGNRMMNGITSEIETPDKLNTSISELTKSIKDQTLNPDDMDQDESIELKRLGNVNIEEFFMMVVAGLAGATPHMQSAAIASISRLFYEFYHSLSNQLISDLMSTLCLFLKSKSREIIKAALGFVKVFIAIANKDICQQFLGNLVVSILSHSKEEKSHFKSKIRHIFERLVKKFGMNIVEPLVPEGDRKLLSNIRKRKERLKKKKLELSNQGNESDSDSPKSKTTSAKNQNFEEAIYGSESELESEQGDDKYIPESFRDETKQKPGKAGTRIREDQEVLDFLDKDIVSKISSGPAKERLRKRSDNHKSEFATNEDGRMIFGEPEDEQEQEKEQQPDYFKESLEGEGAFTRTSDGKIKFIDQKKRSRNEDEDGESSRKVSKTGVDWRGKNMKTQKASDKGGVDRMLGRQYKSSKAGGDVKKSGMADPHAYIPLSSQIVGNKKKSSKLTGSFKNIIKAAQKGAEVGSKSKFKQMKKGNKKHH